MQQLPEPNDRNYPEGDRTSYPISAWGTIALVVSASFVTAIAFLAALKSDSKPKPTAKLETSLSPAQPKLHTNVQTIVEPLQVPGSNVFIKPEIVAPRNPEKSSFQPRIPGKILVSTPPIPTIQNSIYPAISTSSVPKQSHRSEIISSEPENTSKKQNLQVTEPKISPHLPISPISATQPESVKQTTVNRSRSAEDKAASLLVNNAKQNEREVPNKRRLEIKLADAVFLVLQNNRNLKNDYLERIAQRQQLEEAESKFKPTFTPEIRVQIDRLDSDGITRGVGNAVASATVRLNLPTGANLNFGWQANTQNSTNLNVTGGDSFTQNLRVEFNQPLLRGAGRDVNRAPIEIARLEERTNILTIKSNLIDRINNVIEAYRNLLRAQETLKNAELALQGAKESLEINQALIEAGQKAPVDIVQNEADIANRQVDLVAAKNQLESLKINLLKILDIEQNIDLVAVDDISAKQKEIPLDAEALKRIALENRPEYLQAQLVLERRKFDLLIAENNKLWDLGLFANYNNDISNNTELRAGVRLNRTFGDRSIQTAIVRNQVNLVQAENDLQELKETIELDLIDQINQVKLSFQQLQLAQQATQQAQRQLDIEREKLRLGRSEIFQVLNFQDALVSARNNEINAKIEYLNALTRLDRVVGTTLLTWQISIEELL